ncbi:hypothetical protein [Salinisphaera hydrothermalis]|uniref:Uncharacterized protein n=1 Tax=Salinisphaera hydrothermalis (strain C41B8) TaxID=1304275 RepID=A0A084II61_SALHC|nr:hypothetical protein [Salinisphaera hydrothermalis]KEZ76395.1 hypothetical protein C41B8_15315 [Salinisphaera hydrothermalis C41B8]
MHNRVGVATVLTVWGFALLLVSAWASIALASEADDVAAFRDFQLDSHYLHRWMAVKREATAKGVRMQVLPLQSGGSAASGNDSLSALTAHLDAEPGVHAILAHHGMTARDFVLGSLVLVTARMALYPGAGGDAQAGVSRHNLDFVRAHKAEVDRFIQQDMRAQAAMNH